jgi:hypothetical protein
MTSTIPINTASSSSDREPYSSIELPATCTDTQISPSNGRNPTHCNKMLFKSKHQIASMASSIIPSTFAEQTITSYLYSHGLFPTESNFFDQIQNFAFTALKEIHHFGEMQLVSNHLFFEEDLCHEVSDLVATDTVEVPLCSNVSPDSDPLQAIWSFL